MDSVLDFWFWASYCSVKWIHHRPFLEFFQNKQGLLYLLSSIHLDKAKDQILVEFTNWHFPTRLRSIWKNKLFQANVLFLHPTKTSENQKKHVFTRYRVGKSARNGLELLVSYLLEIFTAWKVSVFGVISLVISY